jgi:Arc/MetJ family transcription regulator
MRVNVPVADGQILPYPRVPYAAEECGSCRLGQQGNHLVYLAGMRWDILLKKEANVAKTLIDVNEEYLAAAQQVLHTATKKDTVNAALREVTALAARRRDLRRLASGGLPDLEDEDVMRAAWQR